MLEKLLQKVEDLISNDSKRREAVAERLGMITLESFEKQYRFLTRKSSSSVGGSYHSSPEPLSSPTLLPTNNREPGYKNYIS